MNRRTLISALASSVLATTLFCSQAIAANITLKVGATPVPHADLLNLVKPVLAKEGIDLKVIEFSDYVQPNLALNDKDLDANFFQHIPYLDSFSREHKLNLANAGGIHIEPMGVYSHKVKNLKELKNKSTIGIPNDPTNGGRALALLEKAGLITLKSGAGVSATVRDIVKNPKKLKIREIEAALLPRALDDFAAAVINSNFAIPAKLNPVRDALAIESGDSPYVNVIAVRKGDENRSEIKALIKSLQSPSVKEFILKTYGGAVVPAF